MEELLFTILKYNLVGDLYDLVTDSSTGKSLIDDKKAENHNHLERNSNCEFSCFNRCI